MSKYTETLDDLLRNEETNKLIEKALSTYPMYEPIHKQLYGYVPTREELNKKILNHYRFYEIGSETVGRFLFNLETAMCEIMPYYNQMYKSIDVMNDVEDIFRNLDVTEEYEENREDSSSALAKSNATTNDENNTESNMKDNGRTVNSKTPQSQLQVKSIDNITSASEINWNENESSSTGKSTGETTTNSNNESEGSSEGKTSHTLRRYGNQGVNTYAHDMLEFRELFTNIERDIINDRELATCFMLIW